MKLTDFKFFELFVSTNKFGIDGKILEEKVSKARKFTEKLESFLDEAEDAAILSRLGDGL